MPNVLSVVLGTRYVTLGGRWWGRGFGETGFTHPSDLKRKAQVARPIIGNGHESLAFGIHTDCMV